MKNLVEIALKNSQLNLESDMTNITSILKYGSSRVDRDSFDVPINVAASNWQTISDSEKTSIKRLYSLPSLQHLIYFVDEILEKSHEINHHPILLINNLSVTIELFTHDINDVTEVDIKLSKFIDDVYGDVVLISNM